jgi:hypothetical protein
VRRKETKLNGSRRSKAAIVALSGMATLTLVWIATMRPSPRRLWGDEGTYVAMTESLVRDHDLIFGIPDRDWATEREPGPPLTVILQQAGQEVAYSKPILYPLLSAPLYAALGDWGMVLTNLLFLGLALAIAWRHLSGLGHPIDALWVLASFALCSALLPYIGWKMSDLVQAAVTLTGLLLALGPLQRRESPISDRSAVLGGLFLGMAVSMRYPAAALVAAAVLALVLHRKLRRAALLLVATALTFVALDRISESMIGTANPYKAVRASFNAQTGYPVAESDSAYRRFVTARATQSAVWRPPAITRNTAYSAIYFFFGRHSGLLVYFPIALVLLGYCLRRPSRVGVMMIGGVGVISLFYLIWMPENYFGGSTFIGNRYFLGAFPALLVAVRRLPSPRVLATAWIVAALSWSSALISVASTQGLDDGSQSHTRAGVFRALPFESTAWKIDGVVDRFWDEDLLRFVDPFAEVARWNFRLETGKRPVEVMIATDWPSESFLFLVSATDPALELEIHDWGGTQVFSFPREDPDPPGVVEFQTSTLWRQHSFWWKGGDKPYRVRTLRLRAISESDAPTTAIVRYLGRGRVLRPLSAEYLGPALPTAAVPGATTRLRVRARNTGRWPWGPDALLPIQIGYRILDEQDELASRGRAKLERKIRKQETLDQALEIEWPEEPGDYRLVVELQRGPAARLGDAGRQTLVAGQIRVKSSR